MQDIYEETKYIMNKYKIKANKSLGQNFLVSQQVVDNIVGSSEITKEDLVIEIGPGLGTLTKELLERAGKVICIELDKNMIKILEDRFSLYNNFEIIFNDVLKVNLDKIIKEEKEKNNLKKAKIVANLPFTILYNNSNNNEIIRGKIRLRKYNSNDTKRSCRQTYSNTGRKKHRSDYLCSILLFSSRKDFRSTKRIVYTRTRSYIRSYKIKY